MEGRKRASIIEINRAAQALYLHLMLMRHTGNVSAVARDTGLNRRFVYVKMKALGIKPMAYRKRKKGITTDELEASGLFENWIEGKDQ